MRIGHGFDIHAFSSKGFLILGGVKIFYKNVIAHSDGDVLFHSLTDALLGASALGDIGKFYPDDNLDIKGIDSKIILSRIWKKIRKKGYIISNIDITIILQKPKIYSYFKEMKNNISNILKIKNNQVNIKATTTENLGSIGRKEGIACETLVLLI